MESFVFIHGSSVGQSSIIPDNCPISICRDIADKYFQGRGLRQKESEAKIAFFVDLYRGASDDIYCLYSIVNNDCFGSNGREGQYLAISILCKGYYVFPEIVFNMLSSAYYQMFAKGKIIRQNNNFDQYVIGQFSEEEKYLVEFLRLIEKAFDKVACRSYLAIDTIKKIADYDSWEGAKINLDNCNSLSTYNELCTVGRLFISKEYKSQSDLVKNLEEQIQKLKTDKDEIVSRQLEDKRNEKSRLREEIEDQRIQLERKEKQLKSQQDEIDKFNATIEIVSTELEKYAKASKRLERRMEMKPKPQQDGFFKTILLVLILIFTIISCILNYCFFRDYSPIPKSEKGEIAKEQQSTTPKPNPTLSATAEVFEISQPQIDAPANQKDFQIGVSCNSEWFLPGLDEFSWIKVDKNADGLNILVYANSSTEQRSCTFMIKSSKGTERQITIKQLGRTVSEPVDYGVIVKDLSGNVLNNNSTVHNNQTLIAIVSKPIMAANGYGWKYHNCIGTSGNMRDVRFTIKGNVGEKAVIGYGDLSNQSKRQRLQFIIAELPESDLVQPSAGESTILHSNN